MRFIVTFGQKYRREDHPSQPWVHPDGWLEIHATDEESARDLVNNLLGRSEWSNIMPEYRWRISLHDSDPLDYYPKGRLATLRQVTSGPGELVTT